MPKATQHAACCFAMSAQLLLTCGCACNPFFALHISNSPSTDKRPPVSFCFLDHQQDHCAQMDKLSRLRKHSQAVLAVLQGAASPFRDNDGLAALLAVELQADLLVLLTDVDGLYTGPPTAESSL